MRSGIISRFIEIVIMFIVRGRLPVPTPPARTDVNRTKEKKVRAFFIVDLLFYKNCSSYFHGPLGSICNRASLEFFRVLLEFLELLGYCFIRVIGITQRAAGALNTPSNNPIILITLITLIILKTFISVQNLTAVHQKH